MSEYHCWNLSRRIFCAGLAMLAISVLYMFPALATEETAKVAQQTAGAVKALDIEDAFLPEGGSGMDFLVQTLGISAEDETAIDKDAIAAFLLEDAQESYELILQLYKRRDLVTPVFVGLERNGEAYIPIQQLAQIIGYKTDINFETKTANGFFGKEDNIYYINAAAKEYTVDGTTKSIPEDSIIIKDHGQGIGDFYITPNILNEIWPLDLEEDFKRLTLTIQTPVKLPFELLRERKNRQKNFNFDDGDEESYAHLPYIKNQYKALSVPAVNLSGQLRVDRGRDTIVASTAFSGTNDLLGTSADYGGGFRYESGEKPEFQNFRLRLTRLDHDGETLPYNLKRIEAGDIAIRPSSLVDTSIRGRGFITSTRPHKRAQNFDTVLFEGTGIPGWDVELYRGRELLGFDVVDERGEFRFEDVPLIAGHNILRAVLYGPQGQIDEYEEIYSISGNMLPPGETVFEAGIVDANKDLIPIEENNRSYEGHAYTARIDHGIDHWISAFGTITNVVNFNDRQKYISAGAHLAILDGRGYIEGIKNIDGGHAFDLGFSRHFGGFNTNLKTTFYSDFESEEAGYDDGAKTFEAEARVNTSIKSPLGQIGLNLSGLHTKYADEREITSLSSGQNFSVGPIGISNTLSTQLIDKEINNAKGRVRIGTRILDSWSLRSLLNYNIRPEALLQSSSTELRYRKKDLTAAINLDRDLQDQSTKIGANISYDFGTFLGGLDTTWNSEDGIRALLRASTSLAPYGPNGSYIADSKGLSGRSRLKARIYEDKNGDGVYDPDIDKPVEKAALLVNGRSTREQTNEEGVINVSQARQAGMVHVTAEQESFEDPFLVPYSDGYRTVLRANTQPFINIPVISTGEIDGSIYFADGRPIPGVIIQLVSASGEVLKETPSAFDGFYIFEQVRPGMYTIRLSPYHKINVPPKAVSVTSENLFAFGVDLLEQASEVSAVDETEAESGRVAQLHHALAADGTLQPAPHSSDGGFQTVVRSVRIGEHPYKVRLVLDLSGPSDYRISLEDGGNVINIDLPSTAWDAIREHDLSKHPLFENCEIVATPDGSGSRLRITGRKNLEIFYNAAIPPEHGSPDRIYIDFIKAK